MTSKGIKRSVKRKADIAAAVAVEREACARKAEGWGNIARNRNYHGEFTAEQIAAAIRARGGK